MQEHRIYGPPGTGKTRYLTDYAAQAAEHYGPDRVAVYSYTTAAASEVAARAVTIPEENIGTLHKACYQAIGHVPVLEEKPKAISDWNEYAPQYRMSPPGCKDINSGLEYGSDTTVGDELLAQTTVLRNKMIDKRLWPPKTKDFFEMWQSWKAATGGIDYTDMLEIALRDCDAAPGNPAIIMLDEAQDCTALQFAVLKQWAQHTDRLIMVGDDDQCIYQFAGATPEAFAADEITGNDVVLDQSYRVPFAVWEHATKWIAQIPDRIDKDYYPRSAESPGFVRRAPYSWKQADQLIKITTQACQRYESVMIIGSCSFMLEPIKTELLQAGIPFHNPYRLIRADWNPLRLTQGTTYAQRVKDFFAPTLTGRAWWTPTELKSFASVLSAKGVFNKGQKSKIEDDTPDEVNLDTLFRLFVPEAANEILRQNIDWWERSLVNDEARRKAVFPLKIARNLGPQFLDAKELPPQVTIGTIHSVKGGEADVVILFPDLSQQGMEQWTSHQKSSIVRLMYVGATRAREGLFVCKPASPFTCTI